MNHETTVHVVHEKGCYGHYTATTVILVLRKKNVLFPATAITVLVVHKNVLCPATATTVLVVHKKRAVSSYSNHCSGCT